MRGRVGEAQTGTISVKSSTKSAKLKIQNRSKPALPASASLGYNGPRRVAARDHQPTPGQGSDRACFRCRFSGDPAGRCARHSLVPSSQRAGWGACWRHLVPIAKPGSLGLPILDYPLGPHGKSARSCPNQQPAIRAHLLASGTSAPCNLSAFLVFAIIPQMTALFLMWRR